MGQCLHRSALRLVLLPFQPSLGKYSGAYLCGFGFYFSLHFKIRASVQSVQHSCNRKGSWAAAQVGHKAWKSHHKEHVRVVQSGKNSQIHELGFPVNGSGF